MRLIVLLMALFLSGSCCMNFHSRPSKKVRIASEIRSKTAKRLKNEMGLIPFGFGGRMMGQIKMLNLAFQYRGQIDLDEGRKILMQATKEFLSEINSSEEIRPYLDNYPFEPKNIEILIILQSSEGLNVNNEELVLISVSNGALRYKFNNFSSPAFKTYEETYEEALEILRQQEREPND